MKHFFKFLLSDKLLLLVIALICLTHLFPPDKRNVNYRTSRILSHGWRIAQKLEGIAVPDIPRSPLTENEAVFAGDDLGTDYLMGFLFWLTRSSEALRSNPPECVPRLYFLVFSGLNACMIFLLYFAVRKLFSRKVAFFLCFLYMLGSNMRFVAFSGDVFLFPWYAGILLLSAFAVMVETGPKAFIKLLLCVVGIAGCEIFRSGSSCVGFGFILCLLFPSWLRGDEFARSVRLKSLLCLFVLITAVFSIALLGTAQKHAFWHSLYCGLLEFGGYRDPECRIYPYFVPKRDIPANAKKIGWVSDFEGFRFARKVNPAVELCSPEYGGIIKQEFSRIAWKYPLGMIRLMTRRVVRFLFLNPWHYKDKDSSVIRHWTDFFFAGFWSAVFCAGILTGIPRRVVLVFISLLPSALPPLLANSGYIMYNLPGRLPFYLLGVYILCVNVPNLLKHKRSKGLEATRKLSPGL